MDDYIMITFQAENINSVDLKVLFCQKQVKYKYAVKAWG